MVPAVQNATVCDVDGGGIPAMRAIIEAFANHWGVEQLLTELGEALVATSTAYPFDRTNYIDSSNALSDAANGCLEARNKLREGNRQKL